MLIKDKILRSLLGDSNSEGTRCDQESAFLRAAPGNSLGTFSKTPD